MNDLKLIVLELNEINFSLINKYIEKENYKLKNFEKLINEFQYIETYSEKEYKLLEPWIQWTSAHTGKTYNEHKMFRLGDVANKHINLNQIFEKLEKNGEKVGAISPMNAANLMKNPAYFIPDPWTQTISDKSKFSNKIFKMIQQTVNDNSKNKIKLSSFLTLIEIFLKTFNFRRSFILIKLAFQALFNRWQRSLVFDYIIHLIHLLYMRKKTPTVSFCFFNAGAHIQHHYMLNSPHVKKLNSNPTWYIKEKYDPIEKMLIVYDMIIEDYINLIGEKTKLIVSTGLSQVPYDRVKYYYRLKDHEIFLNKLCIKYKNIFPRMTRDFELTFNNKNEKNIAFNLLDSMKMRKNSVKIFSEIESRENSLFVTLTYPEEINTFDIIDYNNGSIDNFYDEISFVAIKNGMHNSKGYTFMSKNINCEFNKNAIHVKELYNITLSAVSG